MSEMMSPLSVSITKWFLSLQRNSFSQFTHMCLCWWVHSSNRFIGNTEFASLFINYLLSDSNVTWIGNYLSIDCPFICQIELDGEWVLFVGWFFSPSMFQKFHFTAKSTLFTRLKLRLDFSCPHAILNHDKQKPRIQTFFSTCTDLCWFR